MPTKGWRIIITKVMNGYYYVVLDSLGEFVRAFKEWRDAQTFYVGKGGAISGWKIQQRVSKY